MRRAAIVGLVCLALAGCGGPGVVATPTVTPIPICRASDGRTAFDALGDVATEWGDAVKLASSTPRISLAPQVSRMQDIRRKAQLGSYPPCAQKAALALDGSMESTINGFIAFLGQSSGDADISKASTLLQIFTDEWVKLRPPASTSP